MSNTNIYINSKVLIAELYNDYNLQTHDWVTRFPTWVCNALGYLKIYQAYTESQIEDDFYNWSFELPPYLVGVTDVFIDKVRANLKFKLYDNDILTKEDFVDARTPFIEDPLSDEVQTTFIDNKVQMSAEDLPVYWINNNWLHSNIESGKILIKFLSIPVLYDSDTNMNFPLIYNDEMLKLAIKLYVMKMILTRGVVHPTQNLRENNPFVNPALHLEQIRFKVRTSCNKFTKDRRMNIAEILSQLMYT